MEMTTSPREWSNPACRAGVHDPLVPLVHVLEQGIGAVGAAVVDEDKLVGPARPVQDLLEPGVHLLDVRLLVVEGNDDRNLRVGRVVGHSRSP
jgi:hypothetical protein